MKKLIIIGTLIALAVAGFSVVMKRQTFVLESVVDAQALWNEDRLLVVVQKRIAVLRTYRLLHTVARASGIMFPSPQSLPEDLIIIQVRDGEIRERKFPKVGHVGNVFPHGGDIYFLRGSDASEYPALRELKAEGLIKVARETAEQIVNSFTLQSELVKREGWNRRHLNFTEGESEYPIEGSKLQTLVLKQKRRSGILKIELIDEEAQVAKTLYEVSSLSRQITEDEFRRLVGP